MKIYVYVLALLIIAVASQVLAETRSESDPGANIQFPIVELGNCADKNSCKTYCNDPVNTDACLAFAKKHNLMSQEDINAARKFITQNIKGPGGCATPDSCRSYCENIDHIDECVAFAEKMGIAPPGGLEEAKQIQAAIKKGIKPPQCGGKDECNKYCGEPSHIESCVAFGEAAGFLKGKELEDSKKMISAVQKGVIPPPCNGKDECESYCKEPSHIEACVSFAKAAGFMTPEETENSEKMIRAIQQGAKPPQCGGKDECDKYCGEPEHVDECTNFAVAAGFITKEQAEITKKTGGKGPGGCVGNECQTFCNDLKNQETCLQFSKDNNMMSKEDFKKMEEGRGQMRRSLEEAPPSVMTCLTNALGSGTLEAVRKGEIMPSRDIGDKMRQCFREMMEKQQKDMMPPPENGVPPSDQFRPENMRNMMPSEGRGEFPMSDFERLKPKSDDFERHMPRQGEPFPSPYHSSDDYKGGGNVFSIFQIFANFLLNMGR